MGSNSHEARQSHGFDPRLDHFLNYIPIQKMFTIIMTLQYNIKIKDTTTPNDLDSLFTHAWTYNKPVQLVIDVTECKKISLGRILSMKGVLDRHRPNSRKYVDHSIVYVKSRLAKNLLNVGLSIIRTERPVYIRSL